MKSSHDRSTDSITKHHTIRNQTDDRTTATIILYLISTYRLRWTAYRCDLRPCAAATGSQRITQNKPTFFFMIAPPFVSSFVCLPWNRRAARTVRRCAILCDGNITQAHTRRHVQHSSMWSSIKTYGKTDHRYRGCPRGLF